MNMKKELISVVIPAGGLGLRMGAGQPKQLQVHLGKTMLEWSLLPFLNLGKRLGYLVVPLAAEILKDPPQFMLDLLKSYPQKICLCEGGATRQESVHAGFEVLKEKGCLEHWWLIHDAARPLLSPRDLEQLMVVLEETRQGAMLATPVRDTIKKSAAVSRVLETVDRSNLWQAQTPQGAFGRTMYESSLRGLREHWSVTDDASLLEQAGIPVHLVQSRDVNFKVTLPEDWRMFCALKSLGEK